MLFVLRHDLIFLESMVRSYHESQIAAKLEYEELMEVEGLLLGRWVP